jgi:hypothetical protein
VSGSMTFSDERTHCGGVTMGAYHMYHNVPLYHTFGERKQQVRESRLEANSAQISLGVRS